AVDRGRCDSGMAKVGRRRRRFDRSGPLRRFGAGRYRHEGIRFHGGERGGPRSRRSRKGGSDMADNPLKKLSSLGQSIWYDYIRRDLVVGGGLKKRIEEDGLAGMTSNPTIFEKAIAGSDLYDEDIRDDGDGKPAGRLFEDLAVRDVQSAADVFKPTYDARRGGDGFV